MSVITMLIEVFAVGVVLLHCVCVAAKISRKDWSGHPLQFIGVAASRALFVGGTVGMLLHFQAAPWLLLAGIVIYILTDRRRHSC